MQNTAAVSLPFSDVDDQYLFSFGRKDHLAYVVLLKRKCIISNPISWVKCIVGQLVTLSKQLEQDKSKIIYSLIKILWHKESIHHSFRCEKSVLMNHMVEEWELLQNYYILELSGMEKE